MENLVLSAFPLIASSCSAGFSCSHLKSPPMSSLFFHSATRFRKTKICGCRRTVLLGFAGRCEAGEGAFQSHPPFNLHTFRPCNLPAAISSYPQLSCTFRTSLTFARQSSKDLQGYTDATPFHKSPQKGTQGATRGECMAASFVR